MITCGFIFRFQFLYKNLAIWPKYLAVANSLSHHKQSQYGSENYSHFNFSRCSVWMSECQNDQRMASFWKTVFEPMEQNV